MLTSLRSNRLATALRSSTFLRAKISYNQARCSVWRPFGRAVRGLFALSRAARRCKPVAGTANGTDEFTVLRVIAELLWKPFHMHGNGIGVRRTAPDGAADFLSAGDSAALLDEKDQQFEFALGQFDVAATHPGFVPASVDMDRARDVIGPGDDR